MHLFLGQEENTNYQANLVIHSVLGKLEYESIEGYRVKVFGKYFRFKVAIHI